MEDTHGAHVYTFEYSDVELVLILIIMEDTHGEFVRIAISVQSTSVLILIIMEDTHGVVQADSDYLNPFSS